jgi:hypothetical protein
LGTGDPAHLDRLGPQPSVWIPGRALGPAGEQPFDIAAAVKDAIERYGIAFDMERDGDSSFGADNPQAGE